MLYVQHTNRYTEQKPEEKSGHVLKLSVQKGHLLQSPFYLRTLLDVLLNAIDLFKSKSLFFKGKIESFIFPDER